MTAYREYLLKSTKADGRRRYLTNTASGYLKNIKRLLRIAYEDHMIDFDPTDEIEGIKWNLLSCGLRVYFTADTPHIYYNCYI